MRWQCALLQRWLPEYPDGDLPAFWRRRLTSHLADCSVCRQELAALQEVVTAIKATPVAEPGDEFWTEFSRGLHLKLAQVSHESQTAPEPAKPWWSKLPYLLGAPALAILVLWVSTYFTNPERPALAPQPQVAEKAAPAGGEAAKVEGLAKSVPAPAPVEAPKVATAPLAPQGEKPRTPAVAEMPAGAQMEQFSYATMEDNQVAPEDDLDLSTGDLDSILAGMSDQEKEIFLKKLHQKKKDGSCLESSLPISLA